MALLAVENLRVCAAGRPLLDGLSFTMEPGRVLGLVGASGSGKSLTALAIARLLPPELAIAGEVKLDGRALSALSEREMDGVRGRDLGLVFQDPSAALNPVMTIGDQVAETLRLHRRLSRVGAARVAAETLARVGLSDVGPARYPHQLSGGQRQRVAIAAAVALAPKLLVADEPTSALDVLVQAEVVRLLLRLVREDGMGLLLISHDLALIAEAADEVVLLGRGRVLAQGETGQLFDQDADPYVKALRHAAVVKRRPRPAAPPLAEPVLDGRGLVRLYPGERAAPFRPRPVLRAVDGVDLTLRRGETVGIVGESGSGKSSLLRMLLALDRPDGGEVRLGGGPFTPMGATREQRRRIQAVFQDPSGSFNPRWTVERLVAEPLHLLDARPDPRERRRRVEALLERVGLSPADAARPPRSFSGGQKQRIALARALIVEPDILALDEATSALDAGTRAEILDLLADLRDSMGLACLVVSHDLAVVRAIADRVLVLQAGRVVEEGEAEAVFAAPRHPHTAALVAATPDLDRALVARAVRQAG